MRTILLPLCLAFATAASVAVAAECDRADESQAGMNTCAEADYKEADARLYAAYGEIMKRLSGDADGRTRLQAAQRA